MDYGIEQPLKIDPFRQAVRRHQDTVLMRLQRIDPDAALVGCQRACNHRDLMFGEDCAERLAQRFSRRDEAAEDDGLHAVFQQWPQFGNKLFHLRIVVTPAGEHLSKVD